jgi:RNA recognition motif-containing protein
MALDGGDGDDSARRDANEECGGDSQPGADSESTRNESGSPTNIIINTADSQSPDAEKPNRVFVSRIPPELGLRELSSHFQRFGNRARSLVDVYIPRTDVTLGTGSHHGVAFVSFEKPEDRDDVLIQDHVINGDLKSKRDQLTV